MKPIVYAAALILSFAGLLSSAAAQSTAASVWLQKKKANSNVVRIVTGGIDSTAFRASAELSSLVRDVEDLRLVPVMGKGSVQTVNDMLYLKGIDLGIVQTDVLDYIRDNGIHGGLDRRIRYVAKLYNEEVHILAGAKFKSLKQLAGRRISFGPKKDGSFVTASLLFNRLKLPVKPVYLAPGDALHQLRAGEIDAMIYVEGKPLDLLRRVRPEDKLRLIPIPLSNGLEETYLPSAFTPDDYPALVPDGQQVETIAVGSALMAFNWKTDTERYKNIAKFVDAFFERFPKLQENPNHPKWREVNLFAQLPGWNRIQAVDKHLQSRALAGVAHCPEPTLRVAFERFFTEVNVVPAAGTLSEDQAENLFKEFKRWLETNPQR